MKAVEPQNWTAMAGTLAALTQLGIYATLRHKSLPGFKFKSKQV
jgi:hypothetical protein